MNKKFICILMSVVCCLSVIACSRNESTEVSGTAQIEQIVYDSIPLTDDEQLIIDAMGADVQVVKDEDYINVVSEIIHHTHEYEGKVYQIEGIISVDGENALVYRTLVNGKETMIHGLPLRYLNKDIVNGSWVRVTGIVAETEIDESNNAALDIVAIEATAEYGQHQLEWDGSDVHKH